MGTWDRLKPAAQLVRQQVFIEEQGISAEDEWDELDAVSLHFIFYDDGHPVATARLLPQNSIGRVAVLKSHRGQGLGLLLMQSIIKQAKGEQREYLVLSAQVYATAFYRQLGFDEIGEEYLDCGIPHIDMRRSLK